MIRLHPDLQFYFLNRGGCLLFFLLKCSCSNKEYYLVDAIEVVIRDVSVVYLS